jgi:plastocyanin domain-containing protein
MRTFFSRLIKPLLALAAAGLVLANQGCSKPAATASKPAEGSQAAAPAEVAKPGPDGVRTVALTVTEKGYEPSPMKLAKDVPVKLVVTRTTDHTCATEVVLEEHGVNTPLPLNTPVEIKFTPSKSGELRYGCAMGKMISGVFLVE